MAALAFNTALRDIERALHRVIRWKLLKLTATVANLAALRAFTAQSNGASALMPFTAIFVTSEGVRYEWSRSSVRSPASTPANSVVQPNDVTGSMAGRWLVTTSTETGGYLVAVNFWQGETRKKEYQSRIYAVRPSVAIVYESSDNDPRSNVPGAIYDYPCRFSVWCIDENMRPDYEAFFGSDYDYDSTHPGAIQILGDVKKALADENKRITVSTDTSSGPLSLAGGCKIVTIGNEDVEDADLGERVMVMSLAVEVAGSVENPDATSEHQEIDSVYVAPYLTELKQDTEFDPENYVVSGYLVSPQIGLTAALSAGSAVVGGAAVSSTPSARAYTALADTYCDLTADGVLHFIVAVNGGAEPDVTDDAIRLGCVVTDGSGITRFNPIAARSAAFGDAWKVIPAPAAE